MRITVYGCGYVGLVTAACLARFGHDVLCIDSDSLRIGLLQTGRTPFHEPGLDSLIREGMRNDVLRFKTCATKGATHGYLHFIAVGTPSRPDGSAELGSVFQVARAVANEIREPGIVVQKSTVPVGTGEALQNLLDQTLLARGKPFRLPVVSNPEFLKEGTAVNDFLKPDRIIVGGEDPDVVEVLRELYAPLLRLNDRFMAMPLRDAEFSKYAANAMLATRVSLMNEFACLAEASAVDIENVRRTIGADPRIGYSFLFPGCGYGGSCFPKDIAALIAAARKSGVDTPLLEATRKVNQRQKERIFQKIRGIFGKDLHRRTIAIWGLSFKPGTDDMRQAPSLVLIDALLAHGARIQAHDPAATGTAARLFAGRQGLSLCDSSYAATRDADALAILTEWPQYRNPDYARLSRDLVYSMIFDGRNICDTRLAAQHGITVYGVGRPVYHPGTPVASTESYTAAGNGH